jgi:hypothetical protein
MSYMRIALASVICATLCITGAAAQQNSAVTPAHSTASVPSTSESINVDETFIHKQFGEEFSLTPLSTPFVRDIDGDGIDDLVIIARSKKPMLDAAEHSYRVIDPYYDFFGYGDPKLTASFGSEDLSERSLVVLIIHGSGPEAWRADTPKGKFVIINLPFKKVVVRKLQLRKRQVNAIFAEETNSSAGDSVVFWDGAKYRYQPLGTGGDD